MFTRVSARHRRLGFHVGRAGYPTEFSPLFIWLRDHPALYAASARKVRCSDCEEIEFRFGLKSGKTIVVRYGLGFDGDDWWALSQLVEAAIRRETSRRAYTANETKPAI